MYYIHTYTQVRRHSRRRMAGAVGSSVTDSRHQTTPLPATTHVAAQIEGSTWDTRPSYQGARRTRAEER